MTGIILLLDRPNASLSVFAHASLHTIIAIPSRADYIRAKTAAILKGLEKGRPKLTVVRWGVALGFVDLSRAPYVLVLTPLHADFFFRTQRVFRVHVADRVQGDEFPQQLVLSQVLRSFEDGDSTFTGLANWSSIWVAF